MKLQIAVPTQHRRLLPEHHHTSVSHSCGGVREGVFPRSITSRVILLGKISEKIHQKLKISEKGEIVCVQLFASSMTKVSPLSLHDIFGSKNRATSSKIVLM